MKNRVFYNCNSLYCGNSMRNFFCIGRANRPSTGTAPCRSQCLQYQYASCLFFVRFITCNGWKWVRSEDGKEEMK